MVKFLSAASWLPLWFDAARAHAVYGIVQIFRSGADISLMGRNRAVRTKKEQTNTIATMSPIGMRSILVRSSTV